MPGPVVNGVRQAGAIGSVAPAPQEQEAMLPLVAEGCIRLILLCSGDVLMARLRHTTDRDGDHAYQLLRPRLVRSAPEPSQDGQSSWELQPYLLGLTSQHNLVLFKGAVASVLEPDARLLQAYALETRQECPLEETPVERLKRAFQEFTESFESDQ
ncbi:hypothetical protein KR52_13550 [Synechococcus sp. KORDI-52]|uniref:hypothetical protein n=1 Tax=Synechococcus sp. KORDI-52 TaxID=585425 RepID=UPI0004E0654A|nr:hypothetical protein [Synechococcus sp. KORDI-52]AII50150.1 hypothetical protein KR52_13550 [Synechococcus sp. KORDI-52]